MNREKNLSLIVACISLLLWIAPLELAAQTAPAPVGLFETHADVGTVLHPGSAEYDAATQTYTMTGSGENMWFAADAFHFAWKKVSGDSRSRPTSLSPAQAETMRTARLCLMIRQSLDARLRLRRRRAPRRRPDRRCNSATQKGAATHEVQANVSRPSQAAHRQTGRYGVCTSGWPMRRRIQGRQAHPRGSRFKEPFYVGIGVCSHDKDADGEGSVLECRDHRTSCAHWRAQLYSTLETQSISSTDRRVVYVAPEHIEAPNWMRDGAACCSTAAAAFSGLPAAGGTPVTIDTGFATRCNNDHGISPDGTMLAISDQSQERSQVADLHAADRRRHAQARHANRPVLLARLVARRQTLAFCGQRNGEFDIYTIPVAGGDETRLTTAKGLDDGPEYSPDGKYIYFNSDRTGTMQIWRMKPDGSDQEQITDDEFNNWFPHISPDGKWMVFLSYEKDVTGPSRRTKT